MPTAQETPDTPDTMTLAVIEELRRPQKPVRTGSTFGGGPQSPGRHPLIDGLFQTLPPAGSRWPQEKREQWLQAASAIFGLVYNDGEVER